MSKVYSLKDVAEHSSKDSPWFVIKDKVYDASKLLDSHPGGPSILVLFAGKNATEAFYGRNHSEKAREWMKEFEIGSVGDSLKKWWQCPVCYVVGGAGLVGVAAVVVFTVLRLGRH